MTFLKNQNTISGHARGGTYLLLNDVYLFSWGEDEKNAYWNHLRIPYIKYLAQMLCQLAEMNVSEKKTRYIFLKLSR